MLIDLTLYSNMRNVKSSYIILNNIPLILHLDLIYFFNVDQGHRSSCKRNYNHVLNVKLDRLGLGPSARF